MRVDVIRLAGMLGIMVSGSCAQAANERPEPRIAYIAFTEGYWQVWTSAPDGRDARRETRSPSDKTRVSWFPNGHQLLTDTNQGEVWIVDLLQGQESQVNLAITPVLDAVVSPDGLHIAFSASTADSVDGNEIWLANVDGSSRELLVQLPALQHEPTWSGDGHQLYFLSGNGGQNHDIWRVDLSTHSLEQLTSDSLYHFDVAVSPRGQLAYSSNVSGAYELYLEHAQGKPERLTHDAALDARPCFLSETELLFESTVDGVPNIWWLNTVSGERRAVTRTLEGARAPACPYRQDGTS